MTASTPSQTQPHEIVSELLDVCGWLADGQSTPGEFLCIVTAFEARKLARLGYTLGSAIAPGGLVQFSLRHAATGELCASLDVDARTGAIIVQQAWE